jgi:glycosyltransferase involved in cell wall biosynthesis
MKPLWPLFTRAFTLADVVQPISKFLAEWARRRGVPDDRIVLVHNGANPRDLADDTDPSAVAELQQKLGKRAGDIWLVNTARLVNQKANDDTIRALASLPDNVKLLLVGDGPEELPLRSLAAELQLSDRVMFTGKVDRSQVTLYRRASDIFVGPSRSEGLGNAFLSAMASRLPVVATREGGLDEFISEDTAWPVEKDSPEQIAAAVRNILGHPDHVREITDRARALVEREYNWDAVAAAMQRAVLGRILR